MARLLQLSAFAGLLAVWAIRPAPGPWLRWATAAACGIFAGFAIRDVVRFYALVGAGDVRPFVDVPLSLVIALLLVGLALRFLRVRRERSVGSWRDAIPLAVAVGAWAVVFPLAQMLFFGTTDYRRRPTSP